MDNTKAKILDFLCKYNGASGTVLMREFGSLDLVMELLKEGLITKHFWHWEYGTEMPEQYAQFRAVKPTSYK